MRIRSAGLCLKCELVNFESLKGLFGLLVLVEIISSGTRKGTYATVYYREFPVVPVIDLGCSGGEYGACEHGTDLYFLLVRNTPSPFLEREQLVCGICHCSRVRTVVICLLKRLLLELCLAFECKACKKKKECGYVSYYSSVHFSIALRNFLISSSELKWMVIEPFPPLFRLRLMLFSKYLPTISRTLKYSSGRS